MAKQKGIIKLTGTIGDISFYQSQDGFIARGKGGIDKGRIKNDPAFQRTRENGQEFGQAAKSGKVLRTAYRILTQNAKDRLMVSRMTQTMIRVLRLDKSNLRGQRTVHHGDQKLLIGFDFNIDRPLGSTFYATYHVVVDRESGNVSVTFDPFVPDQVLSFPSGASHFNISTGVAAIDYSSEAFDVSVVKSEEIAIDNESHALMSQTHQLNNFSERDIYVVLGIGFNDLVNDVSYPLKGSSNSLKIIEVDQYFEDGSS